MQEPRLIFATIRIHHYIMRKHEEFCAISNTICSRDAVFRSVQGFQSSYTRGGWILYTRRLSFFDRARATL